VSTDTALIVNSIAPVFVLLGLGWTLGRLGFFSQEAGRSLIRFVWYIGIPALLVRSIASRDLASAGEFVLVGGFYAALMAVYACVYLGLGRLFRLSAPERAVMALGSCFNNVGFIGIPIAQAVLGPEGLRLLLILLSFHSLTLLPTTGVLVAWGRASTAGAGSDRASDRGDGAVTGQARGLADMLKQNPVLIALGVGLGWAASGLPFPGLVDRILALPAAAASPVGLFATGLALAVVRLDGDLWQAATAAAVKLFLVPFAVWASLRHGLGLPDLWVQVGTLMAALPVGMIAYNFSVELGVAPRRNASAVLISTVLSVVTLSAVAAMIRADML